MGGSFCIVLVLDNLSNLAISYVRRLPTKGETIHGSKFSTGYGGKGCNQCVAAQKLGARTAIVCKLGADSFGRDYKRHLEAEGVCTDYIEMVEDDSTGVAQIAVEDETGANTIVIVVGANNRLCAQDVDNSKAVMENAKILLCQLETPTPATISALSRFRGISILNAAPAMKDIPEELLTLPTIFCVNESEAHLITGIDVVSVGEAKAATLKLRAMGCQTVVLTLGECGVVFMERDTTAVHHVRIPKVDKVLDTTGAGDCFIGALAYYLSRGIVGGGSLTEAIRRACVVASMSVSRLGTQSSFPTLAEIAAATGGAADMELQEVVEI